MLDPALFKLADNPVAVWLEDTVDCMFFEPDDDVSVVETAETLAGCVETELAIRLWLVAELLTALAVA